MDDDVWEYSYSTDKDASGASSTGTMRYEFDGKKYTTTSTTTSKGGIAVSMMCSNEELLESMNMDQKTDEGTYKLETSCKDGSMISKATNVVDDYEKSGYSREELYTLAQNRCKNPNGTTGSQGGDSETGGTGSEIGSGSNYSGTYGQTSAPVCDFKESSDVWEYEINDPGTYTGIASTGSVRYEFDGDVYTMTKTTKSEGEWVEEICADSKELEYRNSELGDPESEWYKKQEASCEGNVLNQTELTRENYVDNGYTKKQVYENALANCQASY